nr:HutD family protein [Pseudoxanthomonas dokdonensis]
MARESVMEAASRVIKAAEYRRERWKNGLGWTREIIRGPANATTDWHWRVSIAEIEQDAAFSRFPGIERELVLLSGNGMRLVFDDGQQALLEPPRGKLRFSGDRVVRAVLTDGPTQDFNLMWNPTHVQAELAVRPLTGSMVFFVEPGVTWMVHMVAGQAGWNEDAGLPSLQSGDTAILASATSRSRFALEGGGSLIVIRLPAAATSRTIA